MRSQSAPAGWNSPSSTSTPEQQIAARYGVQSIPTVAVFRDGRPVTGFIGAQPATVIGRFFGEHVLADDAQSPASRASTS